MVWALSNVAQCARPVDVDSLLAQAAANSATIVGRLASVQHSPATARRTEGERQALLLNVVRAVRGSSSRPVEQARRHALAALVVDDHLSAVRSLESLASTNPAPRILNDLGVALATYADAVGSAAARIRALAVLERAHAAAPDLAPAALNRGLLLFRLHLPSQADEALAAFAGAFPDDEWQPVATQARAEIAERLDAEGRLLTATALPQAYLNSPAETTRLASAAPGVMRTLAEDELLPEWGRALIRADTVRADQLLATIEIVAEVLAERGDTLVLDAVRAISGAGRPADRAVLAQAHAAFGEARRLYDTNDTDRAVRLFVSARAAFSRYASPLQYWCSFYAASGTYFHDVGAADAELAALDGSFPVTYRALAGRVLWMRGTIAHVRQDAGVGLDYYLEARHLLDNGEGRGDSAYTNLLVAVAYHDLGDSEASIRSLERALAQLMFTNNDRRKAVALQVASDNLVAIGSPQHAWAFAEESLRIARSGTDAVRLSSAYETRSRIHRALGRYDAALADAQRAQATLASAPESGIRNNALGLARAQAALASVSGDPSAAEALLTGVLRDQMGAGYEYLRAELLVGRARARRRQARNGEAFQDLEAALAEYEEVRSSVSNLALRARAAKAGRMAIEEMIEISLDRAPTNVGTLLELSELARARVLSDLSAGLVENAGERSNVSSLADRLEADEAAIVYTALPDRLVAILVQRGEATLHVVDVPRSAIEERSNQLTAWLAGSGTAPGATAARQLHEWLVEPLPINQGIRRLVVVPDGVLQTIAFAMLRAPSGRPIVRDYEFVISPRVALVGHTAPPRDTPPDRLLSIGVTRVASLDGAFLPSLPGAIPEARRVAAVYGGGTTLLDGEATRERLVELVGRHEIVHFAGHAAAEPGSPLGASLLLPAADRPERFSMNEIATLDLTRVRLVVLSACDTAVGFAAGNESVGGLAGALLVRGVATVVGALAPTNDLASVNYMESFHRRVAAGQVATSALREAMIEHLDQWEGWDEPPGAWALFVAYGGG